MSGLCELCWGREVEGREGLVPNCLLYVIARTFSQGATVSLSYLLYVCSESVCSVCV